MGFLDSLGQASLGVTQGFQQGLNIYDQYAKIQDQNRQRQKQTTLEGHIADAVKSGEYDDLENGLRKTANFAIQDLKDPELYLKFNQQADGLKKVKKHDSAFKTLAVAERDPLAGIKLFNEHAAAYGGEPINARQIGDNQYEVDDTDDNGKPIVQKVDRTGVEHYIQLGLQPDLYDSYDEAQKAQQETAKTGAYVTAQNADATYKTAQAASEPVLTDARVKELGASATEHLLQGRAAGATAASTNEYNRARTAETQVDIAKKQTELQYIPIEQQQKAEKAGAELEQTRAATAATRFGAKPVQKTVSDAVEERTKDVKPDAEGVYPRGQNPAYLKVIANSLLGADNDPQAAADAAISLGGLDPSQLAIDHVRNIVMGPDGQPHQMTPDGITALTRSVNGQ